MISITTFLISKQIRRSTNKQEPGCSHDVISTSSAVWFLFSGILPIGIQAT
jgi:hypothetical protein